MQEEALICSWSKALLRIIDVLAEAEIQKRQGLLGAVEDWNGVGGRAAPIEDGSSGERQIGGGRYWIRTNDLSDVNAAL